MTKKLAPIFRTDVVRSVSYLTRKETATMRMKSAITCALVLPLVLLGFLAAVPPASAGIVTNHSGTICKNYNANEVTYIDYFTKGTRSLKASATQVICPLTRSTQNTNGAWVYVDVLHNGTQTTTCTAYSYSDTGSLLESTSLTFPPFSNSKEFPLNLTGAAKSSLWSDYSVLCTIPGNGNGVVMGVDLNEQ